MITGEGKTLVATLPAYLNALSGQGVHVITVNDYLARRDMEWMAPLYMGLGLTVGAIQSDMEVRKRQAAYPCDLTYGTNNEFGIDYLRDNMKFTLEEMVQRPFNFAIVDESRLQSGGGQWGPGPGDGVFEIEETLQGLDASNDEMGWDPIVFTLSDPFSGLETDIQIIGIISNTATTVRVEWSALFVGESLVDQNFFGGYQDNFYVISTEGTDSIDLARGIESALLESGVQASSIAQEVEESASQSNAFSALFEGFTALGLIVGIAALGVIAFRTVAERRLQIGMLRAIGYRSRLIGVSFFLESTFISVTGILLGLGLGYGISYNLLTSEEFTEAGLETGFDVPWTRILIFIGLAFVTSSIMTLIPARSASRVPVAEALRYNG